MDMKLLIPKYQEMNNSYMLINKLKDVKMSELP